MLKDIVSSIDCPGDEEHVWSALMRAARAGDAGGRLHLDHTDVDLRSASPTTGVRGRARWADTGYRVTAHLTPTADGTRVVLTAVPDHRSPDPGTLRGWWSRHLARTDLRALGERTITEAGARHSAGRTDRLGAA